MSKIINPCCRLNSLITGRNLSSSPGNLASRKYFLAAFRFEKINKTVTYRPIKSSLPPTTQIMTSINIRNLSNYSHPPHRGPPSHTSISKLPIWGPRKVQLRAAIIMDLLIKPASLSLLFHVRLARDGEWRPAVRRTCGNYASRLSERTPTN